MKRRWWITACGAVLLALTSSFAVAQDRGQDRNDQGRGDRGENRGQAKKHYRQFNDNQRQAARQYYKQHQGEPVFQRNQWNNDYESRLQPGYVLDPDMRRLSRPAPRDLTRGLGPAPRGYRYIVVGGHVVLVDNGYRVHDAIHLELNF
jgi:Ni/Co efflux regulator RcnB